jgi:hypothetical protein
MPESIERRLEELPLRAVVAFAARCARRVQPLTGRLSGLGRDAMARAIHAAEEFARGNPLPDTAGHGCLVAAADLVAAGAALGEAAIAAVAADDAKACAYAAALGAPVASAGRAASAAASAVASANLAVEGATEAGHVAAAAAHADLDRLAILQLGRPRTRGLPIDPAEEGPLGPLWPYGAPLWYLNPPRPDEDT